MNTRKIVNTELEVSELGFGTATLGNLFHTVSDLDSQRAIQTALDSGMNHFDTAPLYGFGLSERRVGDALREIDKTDYVISTKVGRLLLPSDNSANNYGFISPMPFEPVYDYSYDGVMRSFEHSIQRLGLSKIDIIYMHDIGQLMHGDDHQRQFKIAMESGYKAMDELRSQSMVAAIGLGVNEHQVCEQAMDHGLFNCFLLAGRYTLLEQGALDSFLSRCVKDGSSVVIGGPYNSGILATGTQCDDKIPYYDYIPARADILDKVRKIEGVCKEFDVPLLSAALQFPLAHPAVVSVIPGLSSTLRVELAIKQIQHHIPAAFWHSLKDSGLIQANAPVPGEDSIV